MNDKLTKASVTTLNTEQSEIARLNKIIEALMNRAERSMSRQGSDFSLFQTALTLEETVKERTQALEEALRENEKINRDLYRTTQAMEQEIIERIRTQQALEESESRYRSVTEAALDAIITFDENNLITYINPTVHTIFGYEQSELLGFPIEKLLPSLKDSQIDLAGYLSQHKDRHYREHFELIGRHQNGLNIDLELSFGEFHTTSRRLFTAIARDISERKKAERLRQGEYEVLEMIAAGSTLEEVLSALCGLIDHHLPDCRSSILLLDNSGQNIAKAITPNMPEDYNRALIGIPIGPSAGSCGTAMYRKTPVIVPDISVSPLWEGIRDVAKKYNFAACWSTPILTPEGKVLGSFAVYHSKVHEPSLREREVVASAVHLAGIVIQRGQAEERISYMAHHDALTGLPNRTLLEDRIKQAISLAQRKQSQTAVMLIDLDRFKTVNDSLGHHMGDKLLQQVAISLQHCIRRSDILARLGGDEFVICLPDVESNDGVVQVAEKIIAELNLPFLLDNVELRTGTSIGISLFPADGDSPYELLRAADTAMYAAKQKGRGNFQFFTSALNQAAHNHLELITELRKAIELDEFELFFQPIVHLASGQIIAAESLLRWNHSKKGLVSPGYFISTLEETGLIVTAGEWVLDAACHQLNIWLQEGRPAIPLSVNLSAMQFYQGNIVHTVRKVLERHRLNPKLLSLEFTEAVFFDETEDVIQAMHGLKDLGIKLALDDFGTGYSSLSYLQRFPVDRLKIDRRFLPDAKEGTGNTNIIKSIIQLAQSLDLISVAEGVETMDQLHLVHEMGCNEVQGFLFSRPLPAEEFMRLLEAGPQLI